MTTIAALASEFNAQPHELAAFLDLGTSYSETAELDKATEAEYREMWAAGRSADPTAVDTAR